MLDAFDCRGKVCCQTPQEAKIDGPHFGVFGIALYAGLEYGNGRIYMAHFNQNSCVFLKATRVFYPKRMQNELQALCGFALESELGIKIMGYHVVVWIVGV